MPDFELNPRRMVISPALFCLCLMFFASAIHAAETPQAASPPATPPALVSLKSQAILAETPDVATAVAVAPHGNILAAGSYESLQLVSPAVSPGKGTPLAAIPEKGGLVRALAWSADSKWLAIGSYQTVAIWDAVAQKESRRLPHHTGYVTSLAFSRDGKWLVTGCDDEQVRLWSVSSWSLVRTLSGHALPVLGVAVSSQGKFIASAGGDETKPSKVGELKIWELSSGQEVRSLPGHSRGVIAVAFSPDDKFLASASYDETIGIWEVTSGKLLRAVAGHSRPVNSVAFSPDGALLASGGGGRFVGGNDARLWDVSSGTPRALLAGHGARVNSVAFAPTGKWLYTASADHTVRSWDISPVQVGTEKPAANASAPVAVAAVEPAKPSAPAATPPATATAPQVLRAGMIGLDTSHCVAFAQILNTANPPPAFAGCRIVAAYPEGSRDIQSSTSRVPGYTVAMKRLNVEIVDSIASLLSKVDVVFLETNDGRPHLEQVLPVFKAGKPVFIDKPIAGSLVDAIAIFELAKKYKVPVFSSSSLRFAKSIAEFRTKKPADIFGCDAYSPCTLEKTHPDLFWYGIHGVEALYTVLGTGCETVTRSSAPESEFVVGVWKGGRIGTYRGIRHKKAGYGGSVFTSEGIKPLGGSDGYAPLVAEILKFFQSGKPPVSAEETIEIFAFMEAADESKRLGGAPVSLSKLLETARKQALAKLSQTDAP